MSAPNTNTNGEKKRHAPALIGMAMVVILGVAVILVWIAMAANSPQPTGAGADQTEAPAATQNAPKTEGVVRSEPPSAPLDGLGTSTTQAPATTGVGEGGVNGEATPGDTIQQ
ncbi:MULTISPECIES: hypothetical protein [Thioclava]|uniref:hypothetical protein n=1 Tax=Thioclava TaxID=285107 RepID=UPI000B53C797|nr:MULTISPECIES: hypothetical protein [Thioclava]OWY01559.1 hypothetical protein B6V76_14885 [Thioclava sp. IC9]OWY12094.1 hypothetical protein B6V72_13325 [Thioclava sp. F34-6]OWY17548.1 hypothetical protein B6V73_07765 [Thioclava sp. JM3]PWE49197.1 hypothetical protein DEM26_15205 [Thioclava sp. NG1]WGT49703.1 hypothetical protein P0N61_15500 [Thioclava nitratireducens]